jgi:20S proteasome alpha/beta subunit
MTIVVGFTCNDGLVLCADTQETISGYIKTYDGKVSTSVYRSLAICVVGTGTSDYIAAAREQLTDGFPDCNTFEELRTEMETRLLTFFDKNLARWSAFPEHERPSVELLIGVSGVHFGHAMFHYSGTSFRRTSTKAIGSGVLLANELINRHCFGNYNVSQLASLAIYILSKVKKGVDGCGGHTHVVALRKGRDIAFTESRDIDAMEKEFEAIEKASDEVLVKRIVERNLPLSWTSEYKKKKAVPKND